MKLLRYCLLCLFVMRVQSKPQITKLLPVEGLATYQKQLSNVTKPLEKFFGKLRATYNFVFQQPDNTSYIEKILGKGVPNPDLQSLRIIWTDTTRTDNYTNLKYPNNTLLDQVKSLSVLQNRENKTTSSSFENNSTEVKSTIKINATKNANRTSSSEKSANKIKTLPTNDDLFNDIEPLDQLELQDELDDKNEVEIVTPRPTFQFSTTLGNHLAEWLGSFLSLTSGIYAKLTGVVCGK
ncbi:uncharacterized protein LOC109864200 [Pseudomyrmex gracilis]|uniref:uncharacterized protein LOC109864200 n=1 Tax=Pseudomyrmex gracilis TaxID=219809 RepID=UPI0009949D79|nr:uncharacterized protein LOC109864200 [Pseudomyrmex gracilis]